MSIASDAHERFLQQHCRRGDWAALLRHHITLHNERAFQLAIMLIDARSESPYHALSQWLAAWRKDPFNNSMGVKPFLDDPVLEDHRPTLICTALLAQAALCEMDRIIPPGERMQLLTPAVEAARAAAEQAAAAGDLALEAHYLSTASRGQLALGNARDALELESCATEMRARLHDAHPDIYGHRYAMSLNNLGGMLCATGRYEEALKAARESLALSKQLTQESPEIAAQAVAMSLVNLGTLFNALGQNDEALACGLEADVLYQRLMSESPEHAADHATLLGNLAGLLNIAGRYEEALDMAERALAAHTSMEARSGQPFDPPLRCQLLQNQAVILSSMDRREEALSKALQADIISTRLASENPGIWKPLHAVAHNNLAAIYKDLGRHAEALERARLSAMLHAELAAAEPAAYACKYAGAMANLANMHSNMGQHAEALAAVEKAVAIHEQAKHPGSPVDEFHLASFLMTTALMQGHMNRPAQAVKCAHKAVDSLASLVRRDPQAYRQDYFRALVNHGNALRRIGERSDALKQFHEAMRQLEEQPPPVRAAMIEGEITLFINFSSLVLEEDSALGWPRHDFARWALGKARQCAEQFRGKFHDPAERQRVHAQWMLVYNRLVQACVDFAGLTTDPAQAKAALEEAMEVAEASHARYLLDMLAGETIFPQGKASAAHSRFIELQRQLHLQSRPMHIPLSSGPPGMGIKSPGMSGMRGPGGLRADNAVTSASGLEQLEKEVAVLREQLRETDLNWDPDRPIAPHTRQELIELLGDTPGAGLLQFFITTTCGHAFLTTKQHTLAVKLPDFNYQAALTFGQQWVWCYELGIGPEHARHLTDTLEQAGSDEERARILACLRPAGVSSDHPASSIQEQSWRTGLNALVRQLSETVLQPLVAGLAAKGVVLGGDLRRLLVSPHLALHLAPLHACSLADGRFLGDVVQIGYAPSLTLAHRSQQLFRKKESASMAPRTASAPPPSRDNFDDTRWLLTSNPTEDLAFARGEVSAIKHLHPNARLMEGKSIRCSSLVEALENAQAWHYCGHASYNNTTPLASGLVLESVHVPSSWLTLREIFCSLRFRQAPEINLIGCETAHLRPNASDDPLNIATAFLFAGASSIVSTLWQVNDLSAALWAVRYHEERSHGKCIAEASRDSSRWLRGDPHMADSIRSGPDLLDRVLPQFLNAATSGRQGLREAEIEEHWAELYMQTAAAHAKSYPDAPPFAEPFHWAPFVASGWVFHEHSH